MAAILRVPVSRVAAVGNGSVTLRDQAAIVTTPPEHNADGVEIRFQIPGIKTNSAADVDVVSPPRQRSSSLEVN